jgi:oligopeptide transport system substrate-binding protein
MRAVLVLAALLLMPLACGRDPGPDPGRDGPPGATLRIGNGGEPRSLDPQLVTGIIEERLLSSMFEGLVNVDFETMTPIPGVAESWEVSADGLVYTFHLRDDAVWSNGDPVTADDFSYSWRRILTPALAAEYAYLLYPIENAEAFNTGTETDFGKVGVKAVDSRTLEVRLRAPTPYFLTLQIHFSFYPVHRETIEKHGAMTQRDTPWTRPGNHVSNGPFKLKAWTPNKEIVVEKNPRYWDRDRVQLERIVFLPIQDPTTEERLFRAGELDVTNTLPVSKVQEYRAGPPNALVVSPILATEFIRFNTTRKPFDDARVRHALSMAIDREALVEHVTRGGQRPAHTFVPPGLGGYAYGTHAEPGAEGIPRGQPFEPERAREYLAAAGYAGGAGFPEVTLIYDTNDNNRRYCEALQNMWLTQLSLRVRLQNMDGKSWLSAMMNLDYDLARSFWVADYPDPSNFLEMFYAVSGNNRTGFAREAYDDLLRRASMAADTAERRRLFDLAERTLLADAPIAPVYFQTRAFLKSERVDGLAPNHLGRIDFRRVSIGSSGP